MVLRENKNIAYAKFYGPNKEYYGIFKRGLLGHGVIHSLPYSQLFFRSTPRTLTLATTKGESLQSQTSGSSMLFFYPQPL